MQKTNFSQNRNQNNEQKKYRTKTNARNTIMMGSSLGGLTSFYALLKYPKVFGKAGVFSPAFWFNRKELVDLLPVASALLGTSAVFYLSGIRMRLVMMLSTIFWIIHNAVFISIGPLLMELFIFAVTARTVYKLRKSD